MKALMNISYTEFWADAGHVGGTASLNLSTGEIGEIELKDTRPDEDDSDILESRSIFIGTDHKDMSVVAYDINEELDRLSSADLSDVKAWVESNPNHFNLQVEHNDEYRAIKKPGDTFRVHFDYMEKNETRPETVGTVAYSSEYDDFMYVCPEGIKESGVIDVEGATWSTAGLSNHADDIFSKAQENKASLGQPNPSMQASNSEGNSPSAIKPQ